MPASSQNSPCRTANGGNPVQQLPCLFDARLEQSPGRTGRSGEEPVPVVVPHRQNHGIEQLAHEGE